MTISPATELLHEMSAAKRTEILRWMDAYGIDENDLTVPLLRLLSAAAVVEDEGVKRVLAALLEHEYPGREAARA